MSNSAFLKKSQPSPSTQYLSQKIETWKKIFKTVRHSHLLFCKKSQFHRFPKFVYFSYKHLGYFKSPMATSFESFFFFQISLIGEKKNTGVGHLAHYQPDLHSVGSAMKTRENKRRQRKVRKSTKKGTHFALNLRKWKRCTKVKAGKG